MKEKGLRRTPFAVLGAIAMVAAFAASPLEAQEGSITGSVTDAVSSAPVDGAQITVEGTPRGALTNSAGRYLITGVPAGTYEVRITHIGYRTVTQSVTVGTGAAAVANFSLDISVVTLDEIVATGTAGEVERRKLGTTVGSVDVASVQDVVPLEGFTQALEARIPGVRSVGTAGGVGAGKSLQIRGITSFELNQRPIIYIDGVRVDTRSTEWGSMAGAACCAFSGGAGEDRLSDLNPDEIERVEVLKGAAAATLYGSEASNGVIQIFTKRGRSNTSPQFTFGASVGMNRHRSNFPTTLNPNFRGPEGFQALDANDALIENGLINNYDITASGGGEDITYFASGGFSFEEGSIKPNSQTRGNLRLNLNWTASDEWTVGINSAYSRNNILSLQSGNNWMSLLGNAILGNPTVATEERPFGEPWIPVANIQDVDTHSNASRWTGGVNISYTPTDYFSNKLTIGLDNVDDQKTRLLPFGSFYIFVGDEGERNIGYRSARTFTADYLGNLRFGLSDNIRSDFSFGAQGFWEQQNTSMATGKVFAGPGVTTVGGAANTLGDENFNEVITVGVFGQNRFEFSDKLFATVGVRVDGHSAFGTNFGLQAYPKADVAYNMNAADGGLPGFMTTLKLRGAVGMAGKAPGAFDAFQTFDPTAVLNDVPGVTPDNPGNPDLEPEKTTEFELGFDAGLWDDLVGVSVTGYYAKTRDALLRVTLPSSEGFSAAQLRNAGEIENRGIEVQVNATPINSQSLRWTTTGNFDWSDNKILTLGPTAQGGRLGDEYEGFPVESVWGRGITSYDATTNTHSRSDTALFQGRPLPNYNASWSNRFTMGSFRIFTQIRGEWGAVFSNGDRSFRVRQRAGDEYLSTLGADGSATMQTDSLVNYYTLAQAFDSRDHIRLQEVSLSYQVPQSLYDAIGFGPTTVTLSGYNLHWWDSCNCMDPSIQYQPASTTNFSGFLATPQPRRFLFSVKTSF